MQPLNGRNILDSAVSLGSGESCIAGADLCGDGLTCEDGACAMAAAEDCKYGYVAGLDPLGEVCDECLVPSEWGSCPTGEWDACDGMYQSPINIVTSDAFVPSAGTAMLDYMYAPDSGRELVNKGSTLQIDLSSAAGKVVYEGRDYIALQLHFHLLSEHTVDGNYYVSVT